MPPPPPERLEMTLDAWRRLPPWHRFHSEDAPGGESHVGGEGEGAVPVEARGGDAASGVAAAEFALLVRFVLRSAKRCLEAEVQGG